jgi:surfeit locus 1 family protein
MRRPPVLATLVVVLAIATMIGLGLWQLQRRAWKESLLARYAASASITQPLVVQGSELPGNAAYRRVEWDCPQASRDQVVGGSNAHGQSGWAHVVLCSHRSGEMATIVPVVIGWSFGVEPVQWAGGRLIGVAVPGIKTGVALPAPGGLSRNLDWHIVADPPQAGLVANATPDPRTIANNHLSYAVQWFFFAATALIIYVLALRKR